jgi:hypothetical protein
VFSAVTGPGIRHDNRIPSSGMENARPIRPERQMAAACGPNGQLFILPFGNRGARFEGACAM